MHLGSIPIRNKFTIKRKQAFIATVGKFTQTLFLPPDWMVLFFGAGIGAPVSFPYKKISGPNR